MRKENVYFPAVDFCTGLMSNQSGAKIGSLERMDGHIAIQLLFTFLQ